MARVYAVERIRDGSKNIVGCESSTTDAAMETLREWKADVPNGEFHIVFRDVQPWKRLS